MNIHTIQIEEEEKNKKRRGNQIEEEEKNMKRKGNLKLGHLIFNKTLGSNNWSTTILSAPSYVFLTSGLVKAFIGTLKIRLLQQKPTSIDNNEV